MATIILKPGASPSTRIILSDPTVLTVALFAATGARGLSLSGPAGRLPLTAAAKSAAVTSAQFSGAINFKGRSPSRTMGRNTAAMITALGTAATAMATARAATIGKLGLKAVGSARTASAAVISTVTFGFVALVAFTRGVAAGRAAVSGQLGLHGSSRAMGTARPALASLTRLGAATKAAGAARATGLFKAALTAVGYGQGKAQNKITGVLTLTTTSSTRSSGSARMFSSVPLTSLSAFGRSIVNSLAVLFVRHPLLVDPDYVIQYPVPVRMVQYPPSNRIVSYP